MELSQAELYAEISSDNRTHLFSTGEKVVFGSNSCYLFHIGHRIIDYRDVDKQCGVVVVSIDEKLLEEVCAPPTENGFNFIVDSAGYLVSCAGSDRLGESVFPEGADPGTKTKAYRNIAERTGFLGDKELSVYSVQDEKTGWEIIRATNQNELVQGLHQQQKILGVIIALSLLSVLPMTERLKKSVVKQKNAEIAALEAQINPHFLYNTLDTLQYKAYDTEDEEMVTMISALSTFFRISLSRGREIIPLEKELEHVKSYLKIQKIRFQDVLAYEFQVEVREPFPVLKLILQPLVENAIQHGIKPKMAPGAIYIRVTQQEGTRQEGAGGGKNERRLVIEVEDDGVGIETKRLEELKKELREGTTGKSYGLINVNNRIRLLYGEGAGVTVRSQAGKGTCVRVVLTELPQENEEELYG